MPQREATFSVNAPPGEVWKFIRDFESLCTCIPGVERIQLVDGRTAELTVREKVGIVPLIVTLTARIDSEEPPRKLHAIATAEHLTMTIDVELHPVAAGTELLGRFDVRGEGQLKAVVNSLFEKRATERTAQFAECLEKRFGAASSAGAQAPAGSAPSPALQWVRRFRAWLARLWREQAGRRGSPGK